MSKAYIEKRIRALRRKTGLPEDDLEFLHELLTACPLGLPLNMLCTLLGLHTGDFATAWDRLHTYEKTYHVKLAHWGRKGHPSWVALDLDSSDSEWSSYYKEVSKFLREMRAGGYLKAPPRKEQQSHPHKTKKYLNIYKELPSEFTRADVARVSNLSSRAVRKIVTRWLVLGWTELKNEGSKGAGHAYVYSKLKK